MKKEITAYHEASYQNSKDATFDAERWQTDEWEKIHKVKCLKDLISGVD